MEFLKKIFDLNGRLDRKGFFILGVLPMVGAVSLLFLFSIFYNPKNAILWYLGLFVFLLFWILTLISTVKRGRDIGLSGLMTLFLFITVPILIVVLEDYVGIYTPYALVVFFIYLILMPSSSKEVKSIGKIEYGFTIIFMGLVSILWLELISPNACIEPEDFEKDFTCVQMESIANTLDTFKMDNGVYPSTKEGIKALVSNPDILKYPNYPQISYYKKLPKDVWGDKYIYVKTIDGFELISYGADRKEGGEDKDADIFYSECKKVEVYD